MEVALDVLARRLNRPAHPDTAVLRRLPYTAARQRSSVVVDIGSGPRVLTLGSPESVQGCLADTCPDLVEALHALTAMGFRVLAVAEGPASSSWPHAEAGHLEAGLRLLGLIGLEDPPRPDVAGALQRCRRAGIRVAMVTGDHPGTAMAIAREVGLAGPDTIVVTADSLPVRDGDLAELLTRPGGVVVARVRPEEKLRIAMALRRAGEVVAMTGDGVNDGPALRAADVGVAMGASGSDVAREAADIVLLDDHFGSIVAAVELGRATFSNIRRFLTYHLSDNVAELAPFVAWALSGGQFPLAIGVLQVLALDIGTDMLPALALGAEPATPRTLSRPPTTRHLIDRAVMLRAFGVLGLVEAIGSMATFAAVLRNGGWHMGTGPDPALLATASGSAFAAIAVAQLANAIACRSASRPTWAARLAGNPLLVIALMVDAVVSVAFLGLPPLQTVLGGSWPPPIGLLGALLTATAVVVADAAAKRRAVRT